MTCSPPCRCPTPRGRPAAADGGAGAALPRPAHLALLWTGHLALGRGSDLHEPRVARLVASAIAFHDAVLEPGRADNERASAALWREAAAASGAVPAEEADWVAGTIEATPTTSRRRRRSWRRRTLAPHPRSWPRRGSGCWTWT
jgi:hypothetical protein